METDAPLLPHGSGVHDEFVHFANAGFTPAEILTFVTRNNAAYLAETGRLGQIASGFDGDMILVRENPLQNLQAVRKPEWVMSRGVTVVPRK